jgi:hypothetical protein
METEMKFNEFTARPDCLSVEAEAAAKKWRSEHVEHVKKIEAAASKRTKPTGSDAIRPELWRGEHWRWFRWNYA